MVSTLLTRERVLHAARMVQVESAHHWWDIFTGTSVTARTTFVPPLLALVGIIAMLTLCNICTCIYVKRVKRDITRTIYNVALR